MHLKIIDSHTIDTSNLTSGGWVLDVGCRGFVFAKEMIQLGLKVIALDPDEGIVPPDPTSYPIGHFFYFKKALVHDTTEEMFYASWSTGEGNFITKDESKVPHYAKKSRVSCVNIPTLMKMFVIDQFEILKLDCEGSEYDILSNLPGAISKQITVEYHDFMITPEDATAKHKAVDDRLKMWYDTIQHNKTSINGDAAYNNYWDSLYTAK